MIQKGDLVVVVKPTPCCGKEGSVGKIYEVEEFIEVAKCRHCGKLYNGKVAVLTEAGRGEPVIRLKRIPPIEELDNLERIEEMYENQTKVAQR